MPTSQRPKDTSNSRKPKTKKSIWEKAKQAYQGLNLRQYLKVPKPVRRFIRKVKNHQWQFDHKFALTITAALVVILAVIWALFSFPGRSISRTIQPQEYGVRCATFDNFQLMIGDDVGSVSTAAWVDVQKGRFCVTPGFRGRFPEIFAHPSGVYYTISNGTVYAASSVWEVLIWPFRFIWDHIGWYVCWPFSYCWSFMRDIFGSAHVVHLPV